MEAYSPALVHARPAARPLRLALFGDERLARLVSAGNERAFGALYERYHQPLYRYCRSILRDEADAQDALQSACTSAFAALRDGRRDAPIRPWLFRIAHNEAISIVRRRRRDSNKELTEGIGVPHAAASAEDEAAGRAQVGLLMADLRELPERQRAALVMRELSGLSHEDIALALETSPGTAKQAIFEARQALMEFAEGRAMACEEIRRTISDGDRRTLRGRGVRAHLRDCAACAAFADAIPARSAELRALAPPLAPVAATGVLARITGSGSASAAGGKGGAGGFAVASAGKVTASIGTKALVGVAVVAASAAGVSTTLHRVRGAQHAPASPRPATIPGHPAAATTGAERTSSSPGTAATKTGSAAHRTRASRADRRKAARAAASHRSRHSAVGSSSRSHPAARSGSGSGATESTLRVKGAAGKPSASHSGLSARGTTGKAHSGASKSLAGKSHRGSSGHRSSADGT